MVQKTEDFREGAVAWDLPRLRALCAEKPDTTMALVRAAWSDILTALGSGHTLKRICQELNKDGLAVGYKTLSAYVGRLRREPTRHVNLQKTRLSLKVRTAPSEFHSGRFRSAGAGHGGVRQTALQHHCRTL
jgi:hypothetical protein